MGNEHDPTIHEEGSGKRPVVEDSQSETKPPENPVPTPVPGGRSGETDRTVVEGVDPIPPETTLVQGEDAHSSDATLVTGSGAGETDRTLVEVDGAGSYDSTQIEMPSGGKSGDPLRVLRQGEPTTSTQGGEGIGFYENVELIDQGGMGCILRATDGQIGRQVALKMLLPEVGDHSQFQRRFLNEARITGQLEHPNIVPIHEMGRTGDGRDYFSMKLIQGRSLADRILEATLGASEAGKGHDGRHWLPDFLKICDAISFAHSRQIIHRDLKPANVMVGAFGEVLVMDWGLAKDLSDPEEETPEFQDSDSQLSQLDSGLTLAGQVMGTVAYMPPEQAGGQGGRVDARSDVYALGAILYEMLTLHPPFQGSDTMRILGEVLEGELVPPSKRAPEALVPRELEDVVLRAMARKPEKRYRDVKALQSDIEAYLEGRTLDAAKYTPLQLISKWIVRNRKMCTGAAVVFLLSLGIFGVLHRQQHLERERQQQALVTRFDAEWREATTLLERAGDVNDLIQDRPVVDPESGLEIRDTPNLRTRRKLAIQAYVTAAAALDRALQIRPGNPATEAKRLKIGQAMGRMALQGGDYLLARQAFLLLDRYGMGREDIEDLVQKVEVAENSISTLRKERLEFILDDLSKGLFRSGRPKGAPLLDDYHAEILGYRDLQTVEILSKDLSLLTEKAKNSNKAIVWSQPERDRATLICRVLGRFGYVECVETLGSWIKVVKDHHLVVEAGLALCNTKHAGAERHLFLASVQLGVNSPSWQRIQPFFERIPKSASLQNPSSATDFYRRGFLHWMKKEYDLAIQNFTKAIQLNPKYPEAYNQRAIALSDHGNQAAAIEDYTRCLELRPNHTNAYSNRGLARMSQGDLKGAYQDLSKAIELDPGKADYYHNRATILWKQKKLQEAHVDCKQAIQLFPDDPQFHNLRGTIFFKMNYVDLAISSYDRAIQLEDTYATAYFNRGRAYQILGKFAPALRDYQTVLELDPQFVSVYLNRALIFRKKGNLDAAELDLDRAISFDSRSAEAYYSRGNIRGAKGNHPGAIEDFNRTIDLDPKHVDAYFNRGVTWQEQGGLEEAIRDYSQVISLDSSNVTAYFNRASAHQVKMRFAEALVDYNQVISLDPKYANAYIGRAGVRAITSDPEGARADLYKATELEPGNWIAWKQLIFMLQFQDKKEELLKVLHKARLIAPAEAQSDIANKIRYYENQD